MLGNEERKPRSLVAPAVLGGCLAGVSPACERGTHSRLPAGCRRYFGDYHAAGFVVLRLATTNARPNMNSENSTSVAIDEASENCAGLSG